MTTEVVYTIAIEMHIRFYQLFAVVIWVYYWQRPADEDKKDHEL